VSSATELRHTDPLIWRQVEVGDLDHAHDIIQPVIVNEIIALEEQWLTGRSCERVGKTIAKIQFTGMSAAFHDGPRAQSAPEPRSLAR
jgi:hypothetical protein